MNPKGELIALNLTNILNTDSEVNLISASQMGVNNSAFDSYYNIGFLNIFPDVIFQLPYTLNGTPFTYLVNGGSSVPDVDSLILDLNIGLGAYALFGYELSTTLNYYTLTIKILNSNFVPTQITETTLNPCANCVAHDVVIGTQTWTGCNSNISTYANGDIIPEVTDLTAWLSLTTGAWCYYNNDPLNEPIYGKLYNWYAVNDPRGFAPTGYHVPSDTELTTLTTFLGGTSVSGGAMKETGLCRWNTPNTGATNSSGFTAIPSGVRNFDGNFAAIGDRSYIWSSTEFNVGYSYSRYLYYNTTTTASFVVDKRQGCCVRFIKN
jgi:uncharacterized protein (TIGR02145 family)